MVGLEWQCFLVELYGCLLEDKDMRIQIDTATKEVVIMEKVDFMDLHKTLVKLIGKKSLVEWKIVTSKEIVQQWYPMWMDHIHYVPYYPHSPYWITGTHTVDVGDGGAITVAGEGTTTGTAVYSDGNIPMICSYNDDGSMNVNDHSIRAMSN